MAVNTDGSVELSATKIDHAVMTVRRRHFPGGTPYAVLPRTMSLGAQSRCGPNIDVAVVRSGSEKAPDAEDWITVEDIADGRDLFVDMKKGDYCYGRFPIGDGEEMFLLYDPVTREYHDIHGLVYVAGDARFQVIRVDPGVESDTNSAPE